MNNAAVSCRVAILESPSCDRPPLREVADVLAGRGELVEPIIGLSALVDRLSQDPPLELVIVAVPDGDGSTGGAAALRVLRALDADLPVVAVAARGDVGAAAEAVAAGATDFLVCGDQLRERVATMIEKVRRIVATLRRARALADQNAFLRQAEDSRYRLVGNSPEMRDLAAQIARVAAIPRPVLIVGERGTGKELVARAIHAAAGRGERPFVAVNCAAVPEPLLESELFGHERGAFTGADRLTHGRFEQASGGTLFLDEIAHMPIGFQQKILRVVEYGTYTRVGGHLELRSTARVLAATNADLHEAIGAGRFLADLYDRLAFEVVRVPPLRDRAGDIAVLGRHFLREFLREVPALGDKAFAADALALLEHYPFPGNVRELRTIVERAAYRDTTQEINVEDLALPPTGGTAGAGFDLRVEAFQRQLIQEALAATGGNRAAAARRLGLAYHQFRYYAHKLLPQTGVAES